MTTTIISFGKTTSLGIIAWAFCFYCIGQPTVSTAVWKKLISIEKDTSLSYDQRLQQVFILKKQFEDSKLPLDSVYARILHRVGLYEYILNNLVATKDAILLTQKAININMANKSSIPALCVNSYSNLAIYYKTLRKYNIAANYFDSAISLRRQFKVHDISEVGLLVDKAFMLQQTGDYQRALEGFDAAVLLAKAKGDSSRLQDVLNQRAQSNLLSNKLERGLKDIDLANVVAKRFENNLEFTNSMFIKARILAKMQDVPSALLLFNKAIKERLKTNDYYRIANDYTDIGELYFHQLKHYSKAYENYLQALQFAQKTQDQELLSMAHINLQACRFKQHNYTDAERYNSEALKDITPALDNNILLNPSLAELSAVGNKELVLTIMTNKTELLLYQFLETKKQSYLTACVHTALLTDSLITHIRHEQLGEQSKLFWRDRTREFFTHAMEASYLANDTRLAFYFMEKSRAVLLNDKLNELGASTKLPKTEAEKERELQITVLTEEQKLASLQNDEAAYEAQQAKLLQAKTNLEHYIQSLEARYPIYYQYKYADKVPSLSALQNQLTQNKQSFVHYFVNDTVAYVLGITPTNTKLIKLSKDKFNSSQLIRFLKLCSDEVALNNQYSNFTLLSDSIYQLLYHPLNIPKGRVVICPDNYLIPFDALSTDTTGNHLLLNDYIFSYVYSARSLLKRFNTYKAEGNFIGFAPVTFKSYTNVADLKLSDEALQQSAKYYGGSKLYTNNNASRHNFINSISSYTIANIFSHALSDTTVKEPVLYMYDSAIYLSELQLLHQPATQLVVLSACQTAAGKNAKGEGIFSLARGFATAGIPSVAATLWNADEQSLYTITAKFHEYLSQGMPKDEALQKAKLYFIEKEGTEKQLPYYWANIILVGDQTPIKLSENHHIWWVAGITIITAIVILILQFRRKPLA
jgi:CHAT domain-containing protein/tetratricopeptide (TPR) repeat protein